MRYAAFSALGLALLPAGLLAQETTTDIEIRLYVIHKDRKPVEFSDVSAALTVRPEKRAAKTHAMTLVRPRDGETFEGRGQTRDLGPTHFAELRIAPAPAIGQEKKPPPPPPAEEPRRNGAEAAKPSEPAPTLEEWRRDHVYRGPSFRLVLRGDDAPRAFRASVTVRLGERSFTTRDFKYPFEATEQPEPVLRRLEASAKRIAELVEKIEFGKIPPLTVEMEEELGKLAGLEGRDREVDVEYHRQWLLETARKIGKTSYTGDDDINALLKQFQFRLGQFRDALKSEPPRDPSKNPKEP